MAVGLSRKKHMTLDGVESNEYNQKEDKHASDN